MYLQFSEVPRRAQRTPRSQIQWILFNRFAHSAGPWVASHMYHRFSCYEFCDQRHLDAHRTLPSGLCRLALLGSWPSWVDDSTREIVEQVKQHLGDLKETCSQEASKKRANIADTSAV